MHDDGSGFFRSLLVLDAVEERQQAMLHDRVHRVARADHRIAAAQRRVGAPQRLTRSDRIADEQELFDLGAACGAERAVVASLPAANDTTQVKAAAG